MKKYKLYLLAILSGLIFAAAWPAKGYTFLIFFAFVPLLFIENYLYQKQISYRKFYIFRFAYLAFLVWNVLTTWWVYNASFSGAIMAIAFNTLFMALVFNLFHITHRVLNNRIAYFSLIFYWIAFEYGHLNWELSWSWLNLGNVFANNYKYIQWYEYTGTFGGALWILSINIILFKILCSIRYPKINRIKIIRYSSILFALIIIPITVSLLIYYNYKETVKPTKVLVVQPNIDPYNEKFGSMSVNQQVGKILNVARTKVDSTVQFIVTPETAIAEGVWEDKINSCSSIDSLRNLLKGYPNINMVIGLTSYKLYPNGVNKTATAKKFPDCNDYLDIFNTAILVDTSPVVQFYHKSKLVPGVERMPYPGIFGFLEKYAIDLGGSQGSLGTQQERTVLINKKKNIKVAPVVCYESVYGEYLNGYIKNGAEAIFIITNDGWWGDSPGYKQHYEYARLRAIETRRSIARSANTGLSGFFNQRGDDFERTKWWTPDAKVSNINLNSKLTFYVKYGDYIALIATIFSMIFVGLISVLKIKRILQQRKVK